MRDERSRGSTYRTRTDEDERRTLVDLRRLMPLADREASALLVAREADNAYDRGDVDTAVRLLAGTELGFQKALRKNLLAVDRAAKRTLLDVHLVRQHHMTCAPATLSL